MNRFFVGLTIVFFAFSLIVWGDLVLAALPWLVLGLAVAGVLALLGLGMAGKIDGGSFVIVTTLLVFLVLGGCYGLGRGGGKVMIASTDNSVTRIDNSRTFCFFGNCSR